MTSSTANSLVKNFPRLLCLAILFQALIGCSRSESLPAGINFSPKGNSSIVLNQTDRGWRVFVGGVDVTEATKLRVTTDGMTPMVDVESDVNNRIGTLPHQFRLQWALDGVTRCQAAGGCPEGMQFWSRAEVQ